MKSDAQILAEWGENRAAEYLEARGDLILARNYHSPGGELDLIAIREEGHDPYLVVIEVKTRSSTRHGYPEEAVTRQKLERIRQAVEHFLERNPQVPANWTLEVIAIEKNSAESKASIQHFTHLRIPDAESD